MLIFVVSINFVVSTKPLLYGLHLNLTTEMKKKDQEVDL